LGKISKRELQTGMVVHISGKGLMSRFLRRLFDSKYIHTGIIWVIEGIPFIIEVTGGRKRKGFKSGWDMVALDAYVGKGLRRWVSCVQICPQLNTHSKRYMSFVFAKTLEAHRNSTRKDDIRYGYTKALSVVFKNIRGKQNYPVCSDYVREVFCPDLPDMILPPEFQRSSEMKTIADGIE